MRRAPLLLALAALFLLPQVPAEAAPQPDSLQIRIGQMLMVGFRGTALDEAPDIRRAIERQRIGGVVLFDYDVPSRSRERNIASPDQLRKLTGELQELSRVPLLIAVDQEGGRVARLKPARGFPESPSARSLGRLGDPDSTGRAARTMARALKAARISMDLAPVVDLDTNPNNPVIGKLGRSYSADPAVVARQAGIVVRSLEGEGIVPVLKHFPGHGSSRADSHLGFTDVTETWRETELEPYRRLFREGYRGAVMTAHVFNANLDPNHPATLSGATIEGLLRRKLGFRGVVISDDMQMQAIAGNYGLEDALRLSIEAGVDILLFANNTTRYDRHIAEKASKLIRRMVEKGAIPASRIDESYRRIMALKAAATEPRP